MNICEEITIVWVSIASLSANGLLIIDTMVPSYHPQFTVTPKRNSIIEDEDEFLEWNHGVSPHPTVFL